MTPSPGASIDGVAHSEKPNASSHSSGLSHDSAACAEAQAEAEAEAEQSWVSRYRVIEFAISIAMIAFAGVLSKIAVHMREIPNIEVRISSTNIVYARDPTINNKKLPEQVTSLALAITATAVPVLTNLFINYVLPKFRSVRVIPHDTRDFLLSLAQSVGMAKVLTQFMKNMTGRFRPCFYDMCKWNYDFVWDGKTNLCQDEKWEKEGRRSFPSGHSSFAWSTLFLMTLYLLGRSRINCENRGETLLRGGRKILKLFLCFVPTLVAAWVAITRSVDNWHHYTDIVTGSIIGAFAAGFGYSYNYGSIFNWESAGLPYQEFHVRRKKKHDDVDVQDPSQKEDETFDTEARSAQSTSPSNTSFTTKTGASESVSIVTTK